MAKRPNEQGTIIADFSTAGIPSVEGSFMVKIESDDFRAEEIWAGDLVIFNPGNPKVGNVVAFESDDGALQVRRYTSGANVSDLVLETVEGTIAKFHGATLEQINDSIIVRGLELGFLDVLSREYQDLTPLLRTNFEFDSDERKFFLRRDTKFKARISVEIRVKYYVLSYLRRLALQGRSPTFDEIVLNIMPLLRNGTTPKRQTILSVLETIAERHESDQWKLKTVGQQELSL